MSGALHDHQRTLSGRPRRQPAAPARTARRTPDSLRRGHPGRRGAARDRGRRPSGTWCTCKTTSACNRRPTASSAAAAWHMDFIYPLGGISQADEKLKVEFKTRTATCDFDRRRAPVARPRSLKQTIFADAFEFLQTAAATGDAEADHSVPEHGPLPGRPGIARPSGLSRRRRVLGRPERRVRRRDRGLGEARLHLPAARRHQPGLPQRSGAAGGCSPTGATTPTPAPSATSSRSMPRWTASPAACA